MARVGGQSIALPEAGFNSQAERWSAFRLRRWDVPGSSRLLYHDLVLRQGSTNAERQLAPNPGPILSLVDPDTELETHRVAGDIAEQGLRRRVLEDLPLAGRRAGEQYNGPR